MKIIDLESFLKTAETKGYTTGSVARQTKAALEKVKSWLSEVGELDTFSVSTDNLGELLTRYMQKYPENLSPGSSKVYISRLSKLIKNYEAFNSSPVTYKPSFTDSKRKSLVISTPKSKQSDFNALTSAPSGNFIVINIRLSNDRKAVLTLPVPFYEKDKASLKAYIDLQFTDEEENQL